MLDFEDGSLHFYRARPPLTTLSANYQSWSAEHFRFCKFAKWDFKKKVTGRSHPPTSKTLIIRFRSSMLTHVEAGIFEICPRGRGRDFLEICVCKFAKSHNSDSRAPVRHRQPAPRPRIATQAWRDVGRGVLKQRCATRLHFYGISGGRGALQICKV